MAAQFSSRWRWNKCPPAFRRTGPIEFTGFIIVKELGSEENRPRNSGKSSSCLVSFDGRRNHSRRRGLLGTESWVAWRCLWTNQKYIYIDLNQNNKTSVPLQRKKVFKVNKDYFEGQQTWGKACETRENERASHANSAQFVYYQNAQKISLTCVQNATGMHRIHCTVFEAQHSGSAHHLIKKDIISLFLST